MMWKLKPGMAGWYYEKLKREIEAERERILKRTREEAESSLRRLFLEYHEEVSGDPPSNEPTYPLRGGIARKKV